MRNALAFVCATLPLISGCQPAARDGATVFPHKPIKVIVYTAPGGLIDTTARKFTDIAARHSDATFVVENKPGAGGIVAMKKVLQTPADGHTLYACTKSNISKIVASGGDSYIDALDWIAMLIADPECIITRASSDLDTWDAVVQDARARPGQQIWVGPAIGGLDHVMALKTWEQFEISAKWIPFKSGGTAKAALLGDQGVVYVGNPGDTAGNPDLKVAVLSSPGRIEQFPTVPTFNEFGVEGLDREFMWRGFAVKKGTPPKTLAWLGDLFQKVTDDPEWRGYWEKSGIEVVSYGPEKFTEIVERDRDEFAHYLSKIGILRSGKDDWLARRLDGAGLFWLVGGLLLANVALGVVATGSDTRDRVGFYLIPSFFFSVSVLFLTMTLVFPRGENVGPAAVPRLWICVLAPLSLYLLYRATADRGPKVQRGERADLVWKFAIALVIYVGGHGFFGLLRLFAGFSSVHHAYAWVSTIRRDAVRLVGLARDFLLGLCAFVVCSASRGSTAGRLSPMVIGRGVSYWR